jgi:predicted LPLAT superfamily acyltransferase
MSAAWLNQKERSYAWILQLMLWLAVTFGRQLTRCLLYPITLYYLVFSRISKKASFDFLGRVLQKKTTYCDVFTHFHCFASVFLDRVFMLENGGKDLNVNVYGESIFSELHGKGCLLLGSHLGSFEVVRALGILDSNFDIRVLMNESNTENTNAILGKHNVKFASSIIKMGDAHSLLKVKESIDSNHIVALLADRVVNKEKTVSCDFLGEKANFPAGPITLAGILKVPVVLFFGIYKGGNRYDIYFEKLSGQLRLDEKNPESSKQEWMQLYANRLAHYCRLAPYNWFNFFNYWDDN